MVEPSGSASPPASPPVTTPGTTPDATAPAPSQGSTTTPPTTTTASAEALPRTGFDVTPILVIGALLAIVGAGLVMRRIRTAQR
ncbi:hypothetical protein GCM10009846_24330 [Agrococcus versicolor]|uniref:Gram-positive cocci surface proteins LPxTG domain-containing protein n=1 Tax=Agrococcus versicolor TaxID=501482 RepID=A0ABN3AWC1_9MICO